jgi:hypothetical protein
VLSDNYISAGVTGFIIVPTTSIDIIEKKRLQWYGHVKRMQEERLPKLIMEWIPGKEEEEDFQEKRRWKMYEQP